MAGAPRALAPPSYTTRLVRYGGTLNVSANGSGVTKRINGGAIMSIFGSIMGAVFGHASAQASASPTTVPTSPPTQTVDVAAIVDKAAAATGEKLAWRTSIVDLMKALNLDSSPTAPKELAKELHYTGNTDDSAAMNVWLHKQVMQKLAENGGKDPPDLKT